MMMREGGRRNVVLSVRAICAGWGLCVSYGYDVLGPCTTRQRARAVAHLIMEMDRRGEQFLLLEHDTNTQSGVLREPLDHTHAKQLRSMGLVTQQQA